VGVVETSMDRCDGHLRLPGIADCRRRARIEWGQIAERFDLGLVLRLPEVRVVGCS
jgi:hypothetical protein